VWQTDFSEFETTGGGIWRICAVIDYAAKYCLAVTVTPTSRGPDALACLHKAVAEATRLTGLADLREDRDTMAVPNAAVAPASTSAAAPNAAVAASSTSALPAPSNTPADTPTASEPPNAGAIQTLLAALGGRTNIRSVDVAASRLRIGVVKASVVDATAIRSLGLRGLAIPSSECVHLIVGPAAAATSVSLRQLIA